MFSSLVVPKVLFIRGVFKRNCNSDDFLEKKIIESISDDILLRNFTIEETKENIEYDDKYSKLPSIFENENDWPEKTNLLCWNCSLNFDSMPIFIPKVIEPIIFKNKTGKYSMGVFGVFCSFGCAKQFIETRNLSISDRIDSLAKLNLFYKLLYKKNMEDSFHPHVYEMRQYGGDMTIEQFRSRVDSTKFEQTS